MPRPKSNKESERFRRMVHEHLRRHASSDQTLPVGEHLDEDMLSAFVEGRLSEAASKPLVKHLVSCSTCRHITAQLIRLDIELAGNKLPLQSTQEGPGRIRRLLADLASRVLPPTETEVFAYRAPADDLEQKDEVKENDEPEGEDKPREG